MQDVAVLMDELNRSMAAVDEAALEAASALLLSADAIYADGFGRSGLQAKGFAMRLEHLGLNAAIVGDLTTRPITNRDLLVVCSASGASQALVYHAQKALKLGAKLLVVTSVADSPLVAMADCFVVIKAPTKFKSADEIPSVQPMGSLFEQSAGLVFDAIVLKLMRALGQTSEDMLKRHANLE